MAQMKIGKGVSSPGVNEIQIDVEVKPSALWDNKHKLLGYFPAIFGPNQGSTQRTYWIPALCAPGMFMRDPNTFPTPEEAMASWEHAKPTAYELAHPDDRDAPVTHKYGYLPEPVRQEINSNGLLRLLPGFAG